jgi:hypothetical protein
VTKRGPAKRHAPVTEPTAEVSGLGGRYRCDFRARHVWDNTTGQEVPPQADGSLVLAHPDQPEISTLLTRAEIHRLAFGRPVPGGGTITRAEVVYNGKGAVVPRTTKPVGWLRHEMPAVRIGSELCLVADLMTYAYGQGGVAITPGRIPGYHNDNEEN